MTLTVTDDGGLTDSDTSTATIADVPNVAPTADANASYLGTAGLPGTFDGSGSFDPDGSIVSYDWNFGDGSTGTGVSPTHIYAAEGLYTVTLTVTDDGGLTDSDTSSAVIDPAPNVPPTADASGPYSGTVGIAVMFGGSGSFDSDGSIVSYMWDFGDGSTGSEVMPMHTNSAAGTYTVTLTVTDDAGATDSDTSTAAIEPSNEIVDLDIAAFTAPNRVKLDKFRPIELTLKVENDGNVNILDAGFGATATIVGTQNGDEIFSSTFPIWDPLSDGSTDFVVVTDARKIFEPGRVVWTATLTCPAMTISIRQWHTRPSPIARASPRTNLAATAFLGHCPRKAVASPRGSRQPGSFELPLRYVIQLNRVS